MGPTWRGFCRPKYSDVQYAPANRGKEIGFDWTDGDGSGNLKSISADTYTYDQSSRLLSGTAGGERQDYTYDAFGNITQIAHTDAGDTLTTRSIGVVPSTNRLSVATYDAAGNLTSWAGNTYTWDALGSLVQFNGGQNGGGTYLYDVEDRRVAVLKSPDNTAAAKDETYIVRSPGGRNLREFLVTGIDSPATRSWSKDYVFDGTVLIGSVRADGTIRHYHKDHLESPRLITDGSGAVLGAHQYLPYGEEVTDPSQNDEIMKYTMHQRDENGPGTDDDLDYMLARYYSPHLGRFHSVDPERGDSTRLQTLNRYTYSISNPIAYADPDGRLALYLAGGVVSSDAKSVGLDELEKCGTMKGLGPSKKLAHGDWVNGGAWVEQELQADPNQPVVIVGHSEGARKGLELVRQLHQNGTRVDLFVSIDPPNFGQDNHVPGGIQTWNFYTGDSIMGIPFDVQLQGSNVHNIAVDDMAHTDIDSEIVAFVNTAVRLSGLGNGGSKQDHEAEPDACKTGNGWGWGGADRSGPGGGNGSPFGYDWESAFWYLRELGGYAGYSYSVSVTSPTHITYAF